MQAIVNTLCMLNNVRHAGIYKNGEVISSNFQDAQVTAMSKSSDVINQIFFALESVHKSHNELYFGIDNGYLAAFRLYDGSVILLLTDKKVNFPMLSMAIKSASETIKQLSDTQQKEQEYSPPSTPTNTPSEPVVPVEETLIPVFQHYTQLLTAYLGPAASVVVEDAVDAWKQTYLQTPNNLPYLLSMLEEELDSDQERQQFSAKAAGVPLPAM